MSSTQGIYENANSVYDNVKDYYGRVLQTSSDLKTTACTTTTGTPPKFMREILCQVPDEIMAKYYGCGTPLPYGIEGLSVLDLGSGSGRDCYIAAALTGPEGTVTGIDMTPELLAVANRHIEAYMKSLHYRESNLRFVHGFMEFLERAGIERASMDLVISNCVVNLSPNKPQVLREVYQTLKFGGEFYFSDVYCSRRLSKDIQEHTVLFGECLAGALYIEDFIRMCHEVGFTDPRELLRSNIEVEDEELKLLLGEARFYSITYRCFKIPGLLETLCEDYGQIAIYRGGIQGHPHGYALDGHHFFETNRPLCVCGNTASMVSDTWLGKYFEIQGTRDVHYGRFDCAPPTPAVSPKDMYCCAP